jgi:hypothetical protein
MVDQTFSDGYPTYTYIFSNGMHSSARNMKARLDVRKFLGRIAVALSQTREDGHLNL